MSEEAELKEITENIIPQAKEFVALVYTATQEENLHPKYGHDLRNLAQGLYSQSIKKDQMSATERQQHLLQERIPMLVSQFGLPIISYLRDQLGLHIEDEWIPRE